MPGLIVTIGGKLDKSFQGALENLGKNAQISAAKIQKGAQRQLGGINYALEKLPEQSLLRPKLLAQKKYLEKEFNITGTAAGNSFSNGLYEAIKANVVGGRGATGKRLDRTAGLRMSGPMLISAARDTAASLGSGAPISTVFMQQAPQVAQAFTIMDRSALMALLPIIGVAAAVTAGIAAIAIPIVMVSNRMREQNRQGEEAKKAFGLKSTTWEGLYTAMDQAEKQGAKYREFLRSLEKPKDTLAETTKTMVEALRAESAAERDLAAARGATPQRLNQMEAEALKKERDVIQQAVAKAKRDEPNLKFAAELANDELTGPLAVENYDRLARLNARREELRKKQEMSLPDLKKIGIQSHHELSNEIRSISLEITELSTHLETLQHKSNLAQDAVKSNAASLVTLTKESGNLDQTLDIKQKQDALKANLTGGTGAAAVTDRQRIGLGQQSFELKEMSKTNASIDKKTSTVIEKLESIVTRLDEGSF